MLDTQDSRHEGPDMGLLEDWISRHDLAISLGVADGLAHRARALRLLGNGVHPLAAAHAWRALAAAHGLGPVDLAANGCGPAPSTDGFP